MIKNLFEFNMGHVCVACGDTVGGSKARYSTGLSCLCDYCFNKLEFYRTDACFEAPPNMDYYIAVFNYEKFFRSLFLSFKFSSERVVGEILSKAAADRLKESPYISGFDCMIPVPVPNKRYNTRGYNQSKIISMLIGKELGIEVLDCIKRDVNSMPQSKLRKRRQKHTNVRGAFSCSCDLKGKSVILVDDIYTTGSTMFECAKVLRNAGVEKIIGVALAHRYTEYKSAEIHIFN